jgi:cell division protein FtsZ
MTINLSVPDIRELKPRITVFGVGGAGGNAVNNMIEIGLQGCEFVVGNTDAQALTSSKAHRIIQMGVQVTEGLGAGSQPEVGRAAAEEVIDEIRDQLAGAHMVFVTAGMGGGTGTGSAPVVARAARDMGILTVGVVTKPFQFEGQRRMRLAEAGIDELQKAVDTLIVIPNQNLFRVANEQTTFADAFAMADRVLYSGVACITDLMVKEGLINLDFADVRAVMREMGKAMMGTGEASGEKRALRAAEAAIANPLLDDVCMKGARGLLISITGGADLTLYEVDEAATRIRQEVDHEANVIFGATRDDSLEGIVRVSVVATGIDQVEGHEAGTTVTEQRIAEVAERLRVEARHRAESHAAARSLRPEIVTGAPAAAPMQSAAPVQAAPIAPAPAPAPVQQVADVSIRPAPPKPAVHYTESMVDDEPMHAEAYVSHPARTGGPPGARPSRAG